MQAFTRSFFVLLGALLIAACGPGAVAPTNLAVVLSGADHGIVTTMTGNANVTAVGDVLTVDGAWEWGADGARTVTGAHIHGPAAVGEDAPVVGELAFNNETRRFEGTFTMSAEVATYFQTNRLYINLHTEAYPAGEIRGQIMHP
jgi:hypothetical protein